MADSSTRRPPSDAGTDISTAASQLVQIQHVLKSIFSFYNGLTGCSNASPKALGEPHLTSMRFQRMALDANLIDDKLTSAKIDLTFHKVCGVSPHMNLTQFLDAVVRLASIKFPRSSRNEAVTQLYENHLKSFSASDSGVLNQLDHSHLVMLGCLRPSLQSLYEGYCIAEIRHLAQKRASSLQSEIQNAFVQMLTDFEILPDIAPKSLAYSVFREVSRIRSFPATVCEPILGHGDSTVLGRNFTYVHFAIAVLLVAQRCFVDDEANALMRLCEWMDSSKGRLVFAAQYPGHMPEGAMKFRMSPEKPTETSRRVESKRHSASRSSSVPTSAPTRTFLRSSPPEPESVRADSQISGANMSNLAETDVRRMVQQVFGHYAAIGDPLNRTSLSTLKYMRFLRDCGLVSNEVRASPKEFHFAPGERMRKSRSSSRPELGIQAEVANTSFRGRSGSFASQPRQSETSTRASQVFTVSSSKPGKESSANDNGLPLRFFPVPIISQVEADLIFVTATRAEGEVDAARRNSNTSTGSKRGSVIAKRHHMTCDAFVFALRDIASRCFPAEGQHALAHFCENVLVPLSDALLEVKGQDVVQAAEAMADAELMELFERCAPGLEKIFMHYVEENAARNAFWTKDALIRFAEDFDILSEVSHLPLQKIFRDCTHHESLNRKGVNGEMSFSSFHLALVMIAQKLHIASDAHEDPVHRLSFLFNRVNAIAGAYGTAGILKTSEAPLIPGLSSPRPGPRRSNMATQQDRPIGSKHYLRSDRHRDVANDMSWSALMREADS